MKKIMVVDDEMNVRHAVRLVLESEGYSVSEAANADDCWDKLQEQQPDLILLDIRMPGMAAVDLIKKVKESSRLRKIRIVYMTSVVGTKEVSKKLEGVIAAIEKPFKNEELLAVVRDALEHIVI